MIRKAKVTDVPVIHSLVRTFAGDNLMLPLSFGDITERLRDFQLFTDSKGYVLGCVALHVTWETLVEVRSLAVSRDHHGGGIGRKLVEAALADARELGAIEAFTLTFVPDFFKKMGFAEVDRAELPHKVWHDCIKCSLFPDCGEIAMKMEL